MKPEELERMTTYIRDHLTNEGQSMRAFAITAGLKPDVIRDILRGKSKNPRLETLDSLASALDLSVDDMLGRNGLFIHKKRYEALEDADNARKLLDLLVEKVKNKIGEKEFNLLISYMFLPTTPASEERRKQDKIWTTLLRDIEEFAEDFGSEWRLEFEFENDKEK